MRILLTFVGGNGHFEPLIPIARAAQAAGHTVAFAGQAVMIPVIEGAGFTAFTTAGDTLKAVPERLPLLKLDMEKEDRVLRDGFATRLARRRATSILALCGIWKPDLVVSDEVDFGAMIAAEQLNIPYASLLVIASGAFIRKEVVGEALNVLRAEFGLPPDPELEMLSHYLVLSPFPRSFRHPAFPLPATAHSFRIPSTARNGTGPLWKPPENDLPIIYFTLGTVFNVESGDLFERVLMGLRDLPIHIIATVGREIDPKELGPQPENIRIEQFIPQEVILPHCAVVVSHGGSGSVLGALSQGVPMVLLPMGADQPHNASRCEKLRLAQVLDAVESGPGTIRAAVSEVMTKPIYRQNAKLLQDEIAALPGLKSALRLLERLAEEKRPILSI